MTDWEPVIGLEVHVQLRTRSKLFCRCPARFGEPPNTLVCPVCTAQPGTLPVLNAEAVRLAILAGLALGCRVEQRLWFERKSYFYPDLPKGYQISQYELPLCADGELLVDTDELEPFRVAVQRAHLEEDSGKIVHPEGLDISLVDLNRAGTPLLEIVSGPDMRSPAQAMAYLKTLRQVLRYAGVSDADMEKGSFRCDANVSLRPAGSDTLGTRTETKNLNSFKFVAGALQAEIERQGALLDRGGVVEQQTLGYDPESGRTHPLRGKEEAHDYRYAPEPDLPAFAVERELVERLRAELPELPAARRQRFLQEWDLAGREADALLAERDLADWFEAAAAASGRPRETAHWVLTEVLRLCNERKCALHELATTPERLGALVRLVADGTLSVQAGRQVVSALEEHPDVEPRELAERLDLLQVSDDSELRGLVDAVIADQDDVVQRYKAGNAGLLNALLGSAMKASGGKANPKAVRALLLERLGEPG